ncbi:MAG TPA: helix-turn-helix domain-containing protein [Kofleriaceae bacterium]
MVDPVAAPRPRARGREKVAWQAPQSTLGGCRGRWRHKTSPVRGERVHEPVRHLARGTDDWLRRPLVRYQLVRGDKELCIVATDNDASAGALLWREVGTDTWHERSLAPLEFQLLRALCVRAHEEASWPSTIRGCVPTQQLVNDLPFQSKYANQENVRQVVLRLRGVLAEIGVASLLAVVPGRGYYLASPVTVGTTSLAEQLRR